MAFGVFIHREDSRYRDVLSTQYHFPKRYLGRVRQCVGDWILYLEPSKVVRTRGYFAAAKVHQIVPDPRAADMFLALIETESYLDFGDPVAFRDDQSVVERGLLNSAGRLSGRARAAVRPVSASDFARIVDRGLGPDNDVLPRTGDAPQAGGFADMQTEFQFTPTRPRIERLMNRAVRDSNFRKTILRAYGERCAITGLRLSNGDGRAEVEAAHIRPVKDGGPDIVSNGLALSGTAHWMFDRGLVGLADDLTVLVSRQTNDAGAVRSMINETGRLLATTRNSDRPHPDFVNWHRANCFKH